ncbi:MAG: DEAD/DEAH box helicase [Planctomycetota bacterium]
MSDNDQKQDTADQAEAASDESTESTVTATEAPPPEDGGGEANGGEPGKKKKRRRRRRKGKAAGESAEVETTGGDDADPVKRKGRKRNIGDTENAEIFDQDLTFADLKLSEEALKGLEKAGFTKPTYIQSKLVPVILEGRDAIGQAKTGTGKTAAFALPLIDLNEPGVACQTLILAPTRELAIQIHQEIEDLAFGAPVRSLPIYGGQSINLQAERLQKNPEIIVGTPGRVMDMVGRGYMSFSGVKKIVLDEVDRMLDIGFREDIRKILSKCPKSRQTVFVSATLSPEIEKLARGYMKDPEKIVTSAGSLTAHMVDQHYISVESWDKKRMLEWVIEHLKPELALVFCRLKKQVDHLEEHLRNDGIEAYAMHADMTQGKRNRVMERLRSGDCHVVLASDLASRGIDVSGITHVINYDLPEDVELYVHRIGRTARAGQAGMAVSLVTPEQGSLLSSIEALINDVVPKMETPSFEAGPIPRDVEQIRDRERRRMEDLRKLNRYSGTSDEPQIETTEAGAPDPSKFPGGIVPKKMPPKRLRGKMKTRR